MEVIIFEVASTMKYEIKGVFDTIDELDVFIKENYGITFLEFQEECPECTREDWYEENEWQVRTFKK